MSFPCRPDSASSSSSDAGAVREIRGGSSGRRSCAGGTTLRVGLSGYRCWARTPTGHSTRDIGAEHKAICDLAIERDVPGVVEALGRHINVTTHLLLGDHGRDEPEGRP